VLTIHVVTLFPEAIAPYLAASIPGRAARAGKVAYRLVQLRDFAHDKHQTVDDYAFGGGAGMVLRAEPIVEAVRSLQEGEPGAADAPVLVMSARGRRFEHRDAVRWSLARSLTLVCGHYKDIDQRAIDLLGAEEVSIGDFVLSGGEPAALCVMDAVVRLLPGAIGDHESASSDSHYDGLLSPPSYTRPASVRDVAVPGVLLSGDHAAIAAWRQQQAEAITKQRRPDLWAAYMATEHQDHGAKS
jgi:tRNA (guanine37-N1)-methyltransferase